jgi:hypothetical protein
MAQWAAAGFLGVASVILFPIGLLLLPVALLLAAYLFVRRRCWPDPLGALLGAAAFFGYVAYRNRGYRDCGEANLGVITQPGDTFACGGTPPGPWLGVAAALLVAAASGIAANALLSRRSRRRR